MDIISYSEAKNKGLKTYFTGEPCKNGHVDERRVATRGCKTCAKDREKTPKYRDMKRLSDSKNLQNIRITKWKSAGIVFESHEEAAMWYAKSTTFCESCRRTAKEAGSKNGYLCLDHDHETGRPRAILCYGCNGFEGFYSQMTTGQKQMALEYFKRLL